MMLYVVKTSAQTLFRDAEQPRQFILQVAHFRSIAQPVFNLVSRQACNSSGGEQDLFVQMCRRITRNTNVVQILQADSSCIQTISNGLLRKPGAVLEAIEAFLF